MHNAIDQGLGLGRLLLDKRLGRIQATGGHRAAEHVLRGLERAQVPHDAGVRLLLQQGHDGIGMAQRLHLAGTQRVHGIGARAHAHKRNLPQGHTCAHQHQAGDQVGGGAHRRHAHLAPCEVAQILVRRYRPQGHTKRQLGRPTLHHQRTVGMTARLRTQHMLERTRTDIGRTVLHRLPGQRSRRIVAHHHVQAFQAEVPQRIGQRQRQVVQNALAADRHGHPPQRRAIGLRTHPDGRRPHRSRRQGRYGAKGAAGEWRQGHGIRQKDNAALQQSCRSAGKTASG